MGHRSTAGEKCHSAKISLISGGSDELKREPWQASFRLQNVSKAGKCADNVSVKGQRSVSYGKK